MDAMILSSPVVPLRLICVIVTAAYLPTRSRLFSEVPGGHPATMEVILRSRTLATREIMARIPEPVRTFCGDHPRPGDIMLMVSRVV